MNADWLFELAEKIVHKDRQTGDVIHVGMRDDDVADLAPLVIVQRNPDAARVDADAIVNQEAGQALRRIGAPVGIERAG
jgi:hypothetical protein